MHAQSNTCMLKEHSQYHVMMNKNTNVDFVPNYNLEQCWLIVKWTLISKQTPVKFESNAKLFFHDNIFENVFHKSWVNLLKPLCADNIFTLKNAAGTELTPWPFRSKGYCCCLPLSVHKLYLFSTITHQGYFGHFDSGLCEIWLVSMITFNWFELQSLNLHQIYILGLSWLVLKMGFTDLDLQVHLANETQNFRKQCSMSLLNIDLGRTRGVTCPNVLMLVLYFREFILWPSLSLGFNSLWPSDVIWYHGSLSTLEPPGNKPLPEAVLTYSQLDPRNNKLMWNLN